MHEYKTVTVCTPDGNAFEWRDVVMTLRMEHTRQLKVRYIFEGEDYETFLNLDNVLWYRIGPNVVEQGD